MARGTVRVELDRRSATVSGPRLVDALNRSRARWMWHENGRHKAIRVRLDDLADFLAAAESLGLLVEVVDRDGRPVGHGGLLGGAA